MKRVRVSDLPDQIGTAGPRPFLYCVACGERYSADRGDYFHLNADHVFKCCGRNMWLATAKTIITPVSRAA